MAGLDAIYLYESLGASDYISSITTIATPHRGAPLADWADDISKNESILYWVLRVLGYDLHTKYFISELKSKPVAQLAQITIPLFSVACYAESEDRSLTPLLRYFYSKTVSLSSKYGFSNTKNDGLVPLESQIAGTVIAYEKLDHLTELNHFVLAEKHNRAIKLYSTILEFLEKQGF